MFDMLKGIGKAALGTTLLPIDLAADVVTLGGTLNDQSESYTGKRLSQIGDALNETTSS